MLIFRDTSPVNLLLRKVTLHLNLDKLLTGFLQLA